MTRRLAGLLALSLLAMASGGCAILNPHVRPWHHPKMSDKHGVQYAGDLPRAIDYANDVRASYYSAVGQQSYLRNGVALSVIPMSAAALGLGITGGTQEAITALGLGGASAFGIGTYLFSEPRQRIYLAGSQAVGCAILAVTPYLTRTRDMHRFERALDRLRTDVIQLAQTVNTIDALCAAIIDVDPKSPNAPDAQKKLVRVRALLEQATNVADQGELVRHQIETAGLMLTTAVDNIRDDVSTQITKTEPDFASLASIVSGLGQAASKFTPKPPEAKPTEGTAVAAPGGIKGQSAGFLDDELLKVQNTLPDLEARVRRDMPPVAGFASRVTTAARSAGSVEACKVAQIDTGFRVDPDVAAIELTPGDSFQFTVVSTVSVPRAVFVGVKIPELTVDTALTNGAFVVNVTASKDAKPPVTTQLLIIDGSGKRQKEITVTVKAKGSGTTTTVTSTTTSTTGKSTTTTTASPSTTATTVAGGPTANEYSVSDAQMRKIQKVLNVPQTGVLDAATRDALKQYQANHGLPATGRLTEEVYVNFLVPDMSKQ